MRHGGDLLRMQTLKRADHLAQNIGGDLGIKRCGLELLMADVPPSTVAKSDKEKILLMQTANTESSNAAMTQTDNPGT
jgi:hypothetical protein